ncbi:MAG: hypothetical protein D9V47_12290 [Clostridia bacterium]|nr:MAG: hypothetical protein D9V47_12290 [Clostridia bacterium]
MLKVLLCSLGVLGALVVLLAIVSWAAGIAWDQRIKGEVNELFAGVPGKANDSVITESDLEGLPEIVQKWLKNSNVLGKERVRSVRLKQRGVIRAKEGQPWMPFEAVQYYTVDKPGFIWSVRAKAAPLINLVGRDRYYDGSAHMLIKLLSLMTVVDGRGDEINQGSLLRFLSEIMWFPTAALSEYIKWEPVDKDSAKATMSYKGATASGVFTFSEQGDAIHFVAKRYYSAADGGYSLETWSGAASDHRGFGGIRIPAKAEVMWNLETGDFSYWKGEVTEIEYNAPALY